MDRIKIDMRPIKQFERMMWIYYGTYKPPLKTRLEVEIAHERQKMLTVAMWRRRTFNMLDYISEDDINYACDNLYWVSIREKTKQMEDIKKELFNKALSNNKINNG